MTRAAGIGWAVLALLGAAPPLASQRAAPSAADRLPANSAPPDANQFQHVQLETRTGASVAAEIQSIARAANSAWIAWRVPMIAGDRHLCSSWSAGDVPMHGELLTQTGPDAMPRLTPPSGPLRLDAGTGLVLLARTSGGHLERLRVVTDDCPIDGGDSTVFWLAAATPAASLAFLDTVSRDPSLAAPNERLAEAAVTAISLHADDAADAMLERLLAPDFPAAVRQRALAALAGNRGAHGFEAVIAALPRVSEASAQAAIAALVENPDPRVAPALLRLTQQDPVAAIRAAAVAAYARRAGAAALPDVLAVVANDSADTVKRRAVSAIGTMPGSEPLDSLIALARGSGSLAVRKEAVSVLSRSADPRARQVLEAIVAQ
jgi:hypothetical protein